MLIELPEPIQSALEDTFRAGEVFFRQPLSKKMADRLPLDSGYRPLRAEYSNLPEHPDEVESFTSGYRTGISEGVLLSGNGARLHERMLGLFGLLEPLVEEVTIELFAHFTGALSETFRNGLHSSSLLQLNYSRPSETSVEYLNELHEDGCLLTLTSVTGPGLELQTGDDTYLQIAPSQNKLLLMAGEILSLITGGEIRTIFHRVRRSSIHSERMSLLFFADLHPKLCNPWISNETNLGIDIGDRVLKNASRFGLSEWQMDQLS